MKCEALRLDHVRVDQPTRAFIDISMNVFEEEFLCVLIQNQRRSRCLTALLSGRIRHSAGQFYVYEREVASLTPELARRVGLYTIGPKPTLVPTQSIAENLFISNSLFYPRGVFKHRLMEISAAEWMDATGIYDMNPGTKVRELDIAQAHIVEILKALTLGAKIIVLDNVYTFYSDSQREKLFAFLKRLKESHLLRASLVMICDSYGLLWQLADRGAIIHHGRCIAILPREKMTHEGLNGLFNGASQGTSIGVSGSGREVLSVAHAPHFPAPDHRIIRLTSGVITALLDKNQLLRGIDLPSLMGNPPSFLRFSLNGRLLSRGRFRHVLKKDICILNCHEIDDCIIERMDLCQNVMLLMKKPVYGFLGHENKRMLEFATRNIFEQLGAMDLFEAFQSRNRLDALSNSQKFTVFLARFAVRQPQVLLIIDPQICFDEAQYARFVALMRSVCQQEIALAVVSCTQDILLSVSDHYLTLEGDFLD